MYSLKARNESGDMIDITGSEDYDVIKIDGLTPAAAEVSMQEAVGYDGGMFSYSRTNSRNIVIELVLCGDIEIARQRLYTYFPPKKYMRLYFESEYRRVYIDGYTESVEGNLFELGQKMQISIICPKPYFIDNSNPEYELTPAQTMGVFEFPFEVDTSSQGIEFSQRSSDGLSVSIPGGETESGIIFYINFNRYTTSPRDITISNETAKTAMTVKNNNLWGSDKGLLYINSFDGEKQAYYRTSNGTLINVIPYITITGDWVKLIPGTNLLTIKNTETSGQSYTAYCHAYRYFLGV